jgi:hypothetical protein
MQNEHWKTDYLEYSMWDCSQSKVSKVKILQYVNLAVDL